MAKTKYMPITPLRRSLFELAETIPAPYFVTGRPHPSAIIDAFLIYYETKSHENEDGWNPELYQRLKERMPDYSYSDCLLWITQFEAFFLKEAYGYPNAAPEEP